MPLRQAHRTRQADLDRQVEKLLTDTDDVLIRSQARVRQSFAGLGQAREQNRQHREQLEEWRQKLAMPRAYLAAACICHTNEIITQPLRRVYRWRR